jgi:hypothetical protein
VHSMTFVEFGCVASSPPMDANTMYVRTGRRGVLSVNASADLVAATPRAPAAGVARVTHDLT